MFDQILDVWYDIQDWTLIIGAVWALFAGVEWLLGPKRYRRYL
jgi:hypothetical protein